MIDTEHGRRRLFLSAALFNLGCAAIFAVGRSWVFGALGFEPAPQPALWYELVLLAIAVFGYGYGCVAFDPTQTLVVQMGVIAKLGFVALILGHWIAGHASWQLAALVLVDLVYAVLFLAFLRGRRASGPR
ncbi:MAG: hypothetical protein IT522_04715 [Burkholderiales bacterium]|nr:hypothetical protein [Burkholderiales bacterium]